MKYWRLQGKPYAIVLCLYLVILAIWLIDKKPRLMRLASISVVFLLAATYCHTWTLIFTVPALWFRRRA